MRYLLPLAVLGLGFVLWRFSSIEIRDPVEVDPAATENRGAPIGESEDLTDPDPLADVSFRAEMGAQREVVGSEPAHHPDDLARIQKLEEEITALETERKALREQVAFLQLALLREQNPEATPLGAFLHSEEAEAIPEEQIRVHVREWLERFPVFLRPGEATWIAERERIDDWLQFGRTAQLAVIHFLGINRLKAELPEERLAELREYYEEEGLFD